MHPKNDIVVYVTRRYLRSPELTDLAAPANYAIAYRMMTINGNIVQHNEFVGTPRPELEKAWTRISTGKFDLQCGD